MGDLRVLVVDDEEELVSTLVERLTLRGIDAEGATNGASALDRIREKDFDVVVLDVKMPKIGGLEVMREIRAKSPGVQIILLTGRGSEKESEIGLKEGAFAYILKPFEIEGLISKMKEAVGR